MLAWLDEEGILPPGPGAGHNEGYPRIASQKWLGSLGQQAQAGRVDLQIKVHRATADEPEEGGLAADIVLVESKIGSREGKQQLRRYAEHLHNIRGYDSKTLLYITRGHDPKERGEILSGIDDVRFEQRRWRDFYRFLQGVAKDALVDEVMTFMEEQGMGKDYRFSADDLIALSGLPRALDILEETIDAEVREELARFAGNGIERAPANLMQQIRGDEGYFIYASLDDEGNFGCYVGYAMRNPDGYPRLHAGLYAYTAAAGSKLTRAAIERVSRLEGWHTTLGDPEAHEILRETHLASLLGEKDHVVAARRFFVESIRQLEDELTAFKREHPALPWGGPRA